MTDRLKTDSLTTVRTIHWSHGSAEVQSLGGMLAPVSFRAAGHADFEPMQVAPWATEAGAERWTGLLGRLRGEWPCVPFGRCDRPSGLPAGWTPRDPGDDWGHGYASHHDWTWSDTAADAQAEGVLRLHIDLPIAHPIARLRREIRAIPGEASLEVVLNIEARRDCQLPVALHPTLRLDAGRVALEIAHAGPGLTYPVPAEPGRSRLQPNARFERLDAVPLATAPGASTATGDFSRYPQPADSEDLLLLQDLRGPVTARFLDRGWALTLDWDRSALPDLMLWVSHRGRLYEPWNGRHWALGLEPVHGAFDLGRVFAPPPGHPLAARTGLRLHAGESRVIRASLRARPLPADTP